MRVVSFLLLPILVCAIPYHEADALLSLREKCAGKTLANVASSWNRTKDCSDWKGVICDSAQHVIEINLDGGGGLEVSQATTTCSTTTWNSLDLTPLAYLSSVSIHGLLEGPIPQSLTQLVALSSLDLSGNKLLGKLSTTVPLLRNLRYLKLAANQLSGTIPNNLPQLSTLDLHKNQLSGVFDPKILTTPGLNMIIHFDVGHNKLKGDISAIAPLPGLRFFDMSRNLLTGKLPKNLVDIRRSSSNRLRVIHLDHNSFKGSIPSSFAKLRGLDELTVQDNKLTGLIPRFDVDTSDNFRINLTNNDFSCPRPKKDVYKSADDCTCRAGHFSRTNSAADCRLCPPQTFVAKDSKKFGGKTFVRECTPCTSPAIAPNVGSTACVQPTNLDIKTSTPAARAATTTDTLRYDREIAVASISLAIVLLFILVTCSIFCGCFTRERDDERRDDKSILVVKDVIDEQVMKGTITRVDGAMVFNKWRNSYYSKSKPRRCCKFLLFKMNQKKFAREMKKMGNEHKRQRQQQRGNRVTPQWQVQDNAYQQDKAPNKNDEVKPYAQNEQSDSDCEYPFPNLSNDQWKIKQTHSQRRFTHGDWDKYQDNHTGNYYYYNHVTDDWQWEKPDDYVEDEMGEVAERPLSKSQWQIKQTHSQRRFTYGDWDKYQDEETGDYYYYNHTTEEWQWKQPDDYVEDEHGEAY